MENREQQIFLEIREMIASMRAQLDALEAKVDMLSQAPVIEEVEDEPIDLDIEDVLDDIPVAEAVAPVAETVVAEAVEAAVEPVVAEVVEEVAGPAVDDDLPFDDEPVFEEPVLIADVPVVSEEPVVEEDLPVVVEDDLPVVVEEDMPVSEILIDAAAANAKTAVIDAMTAKESWRTDIPGSPVKDIRSAISLHDRIIFINGLFGEDPMLFQEVLTAINSMTSVEDAVAYLAEKRPEWDMNSDEVYRFMMAVRRRIQ